MKKRSLFLGTVILMSISLNSCGVMFGGSRYNGTIIAKDHPNAQIYVNGEKAGTGTVKGTYRRDTPLEVELKQDGCEEHKKTYHNVFRTGNFILSVITWGIIGLGVDLGTGASYKPDHRKDADITKENDKDYIFTIEIPDCEN